MTEKNNKYKSLDESTANKIGLIKALDDKNYEVDNPSISDYDKITEKFNGDDLLIQLNKYIDGFIINQTIVNIY